MEHLKKQGKIAFAEKNYTAAANIYGQALQLSGEAVLYSNRSQCYLNLGLWDLALKDCDSGLRENPANNIREKLLYRKAMAAKCMGNNELAVTCLEDLLKISPSNASAKSELQLVMSKVRVASAAKKVKVWDGEKVPLEVVDRLPVDFARIFNNQPDILPIPGNTELVDKVSQDLFLDRPQKRLPPLPLPPPPVSFTQRPAMLKLRILDQLLPDVRARAFRSVVQLDCHDIKELGDVEPEFFELYIDSCTFGLANNSITCSQLIERLTVFRSLRRFQIALNMCSPQKISDLLRQVEILLPTSVQSVRELLS